VSTPNLDPVAAAQPGSHESRIARGAFSQQAALVVGTLAMLAALTLLARRLTLTEFGLYGLLTSVVVYLQVIQISVEGAAVNAIAKATDGRDRDEAFTAALVSYAIFGAIAGALLAAIGLAVIEVAGVPGALRSNARAAVVALGVATALGWPAKVFHDWLRGVQRFATAALAEICAYLVFLALVLTLLEAGAPLWTIVLVGGSLPILIGVCAASIVLVGRRARPRFERTGTARAGLRRLLAFSASLFSLGISDLVVYQLDRVVLAGFRSTAAVGLYEAAARPHQLVRQLHGTLASTVMPAASAYIAAGDEYRVRELLVRGTRYVLAAVAPVVVVLVVLSGPIIHVWLGDRFSDAAPGMAIFVSYWILGANTGVAGSMLVAAEKLRALNVYAWAGAVLNLALSLILTPRIGLEGPIIGTVVPYVLLLPWFWVLVRRTFPVSLGELWREAWLPAYTTAAVVGAALVGLRLAVDVETLPEVVAAALGALALGWIGYYAVWLRPNERLLLRSFLRRGA
jgi:O-antigen/teichoic acid export membrane protein